MTASSDLVAGPMGGGASIRPRVSPQACDGALRSPKVYRARSPDRAEERAGADDARKRGGYPRAARARSVRTSAATTGMSWLTGSASPGLLIL